MVGALDISETGELIRLQNLAHEATVGKRTRLVPARLIVRQPPKRTVAVRAGFLCDNAGYLLGHNGKRNPKRAADQFAAARTLHEAVLGALDDRGALAILAFFRSWDPAKAAAFLAEEADEMASGWLVLPTPRQGFFSTTYR